MRIAAAATKFSSMNSSFLPESLSNRTEQPCRASSRHPKTTLPLPQSKPERGNRVSLFAALRGRPSQFATLGLLVSWSVPPPGGVVAMAKDRSGGGRGRSRETSAQVSRKKSLALRTAYAWASQRQRLRPNPSFKRSAAGRPPRPGCRYAVHCRQPGLGVLPAAPA